MSKNFSKVLKIGTDFDVNSVINGLKKIKDELNSKSKDESLFTDVNEQMKDIERLYKKFQQYQQKGIYNNTEAQDYIKTTDKLNQSLKSVYKELGRINTSKDFKNSAFQEIDNQIKNTEKQLSELKTKYQDIKTALEGSLKNGLGMNKTDSQALLKNVKTSQELGDILKKQAEEQEKITQSKKEALKTEIETLKQQKKNNLTMSQVGNRFGNSLFVNSGASKEDLDKRKDIKSILLTEINSSIGKGHTGEQGWEAFSQKFTSELKNFFKDIEEAGKVFKNIIDSNRKDITSKENALAKLNDSENKFGTFENGQFKASMGTMSVLTQGMQLDQVNSQIKLLESNLIKLKQDKEDLDKSFKGPMSESLVNAHQETEALNAALEKSKEETSALAQSQTMVDNAFDSVASTISRITSLTNIFFQLRRVVTQTFTDVRNLDAAFASIAMVTNLSLSDLWGTYDQYAEMANRLGQSTKDVIEASALFYQQG